MLPTSLASAHERLSRLAACVGLSPYSSRFTILSTSEVCLCVAVARFLAVHRLFWSKTIVTRDLDWLSGRLTRWGATATSLPLILSSEMNILELPRVFSKCSKTFSRILTLVYTIRFLSLSIKFNACFHVYDNASPCAEPHWLLSVKLPHPVGSLQLNFQTSLSYCVYVIALMIYQCHAVRTEFLCRINTMLNSAHILGLLLSCLFHTWFVYRFVVHHLGL